MDSLEQDFIKLYQKNKQPIFNYLYRLSGDKSVAEEILQDSFLKAYLNLGSFRGESSLKTWLYKIARHTYLTYAKKENRANRKRIDQFFGYPTQDTKNDPEQVALNNELRNDLLQVLSLLPENYRTVIILREIQGLAYGEIASVLGFSLEWVKVAIYRARRRFRELYQKQRQEGGKKDGL